MWMSYMLNLIVSCFLFCFVFVYFQFSDDFMLLSSVSLFLAQLSQRLNLSYCDWLVLIFPSDPRPNLK